MRRERDSRMNSQGLLSYNGEQHSGAPNKSSGLHPYPTETMALFIGPSKLSLLTPMWLGA